MFRRIATLASLSLLAFVSSASGAPALGDAPGHGGLPAGPTSAAGARQLPSARSLYRASVAAAAASLRLHETTTAREWLESAPADQRGWEWRYLSAELDRSSGSASISRSPLTSIDVSADGRLLAVASEDATAKIIDASTLTVVRILAHQRQEFRSIAFSPDGRNVAAGSGDAIFVWDVATGALSYELRGQGEGRSLLAWAPDGSALASSGWLGPIRIYNPEDGTPVREIATGDDRIVALAYDSDGSRLAIGTGSGDVIVRHARSREEPAQLRAAHVGTPGRVTSVSFSHDGSRVSVVYADGSARLWSVGRRSLENTLYVPDENGPHRINAVIWIPGREWLAGVGTEPVLRLWSAETGRGLAELHGPESGVRSIAASPDGRWLYTGEANGTLRKWDLAAHGPQPQTWPIDRSPHSITLDPGHERAVVATWGGWLRVFDVRTGTQQLGWFAHGGPDRAPFGRSNPYAGGTAWSPDGRWIASGGGDGRIVLWDAASGELVRELQDESVPRLLVAFSPDGSLLAAHGGPGEVRVWRIPSGEEVASVPAGEAGSMVWRSDETLVTTAEGIVHFWNVHTSQLEAAIRVDRTGSSVLALHPTGRSLAIARQRAVRVWDFDAGDWLNDGFVASAPVLSMSYSPDGTRLAAAMGGNSPGFGFEIWDEAGEKYLRIDSFQGARIVAWTRREQLLLLPLDATVRVLGSPLPPDRRTEVATVEEPPATTARDTFPWREQLEYLASGVWIASNAEYRESRLGEPDELGMRFWMGVGGSAQQGCQWEQVRGRLPDVMHGFTTAWDPGRRQFLVQQASVDGVIAIGHRNPETGVTEHQFTSAAGTSWRERHLLTLLPPDSLLTRSDREAADGTWQSGRTYRWERRPARTPC